MKKTDQEQANKRYLITAISHYPFLLFFQNTKLKQKNKLSEIQSKIQENIINASINGQELERKKLPTSCMTTSALYYHRRVYI
jgi:hypothetical protein